MKILCLACSLDAGGAERVLTNLCNAWSARGDDVTLIPTFSQGGRPFYDIAESVEVIYLADVVGAKKKNPATYARRVIALRRLITDRAPDVIISFMYNVNVAAILTTAFLRIPLIICERSDPGSRSPYGFWEICAKLTYRFADMFTVQTASLAEKVPRLYPGLAKVRVVPNPLSNDFLIPVHRAEGRRMRLVSVGRLVPEKQVERMIRAFSDLSSKFDNWDLHIFGDGPERPMLESEIARTGLQHRVFLRGRTKTPWQVMSQADAFMMTSRHEGFPNALLEAMATGLPCAVFDCPSGPREITRNGEDALLIPLNDHAGLVSALARLMGDRQLRESLGKQARNSVCSRFSTQEVVRQWDLLFRELGAGLGEAGAPVKQPSVSRNFFWER